MSSYNTAYNRATQPSSSYNIGTQGSLNRRISPSRIGGNQYNAYQATGSARTGLAGSPTGNYYNLANKAGRTIQISGNTGMGATTGGERRISGRNIYQGEVNNGYYGSFGYPSVYSDRGYRGPRNSNNAYYENYGNYANYGVNANNYGVNANYGHYNRVIGTGGYGQLSSGQLGGTTRTLNSTGGYTTGGTGNTTRLYQPSTQGTGGVTTTGGGLNSYVRGTGGLGQIGGTSNGFGNAGSTQYGTGGLIKSEFFNFWRFGSWI